MKTRLVIRLVAFVLLMAWAWFLMTRDGQEGEAPSPGTEKPAPPPEEPAPTGDTLDLTEDLSAKYLAGYGGPQSTPEKDLSLVRDVLEAFSYTIKVPDALPTAGNREIVNALVGSNAYRIRFLDPQFAHLNESGELVDRWQSPLYFHFVEANEVGIRSAGPDQQLWTADDVTFGEFADPLPEEGP